VAPPGVARFLFEDGFERRLLAGRRWRSATAVAFPQKSESILLPPRKLKNAFAGSPIGQAPYRLRRLFKSPLAHSAAAPFPTRPAALGSRGGPVKGALPFAAPNLRRISAAGWKAGGHPPFPQGSASPSLLPDDRILISRTPFHKLKRLFYFLP